MDVCFEDIISVYVPAASIIKIIDQEDKLLHSCIKKGFTIESAQRFKLYERDLATCVSILQKATENLFGGEARVLIPAYDGKNYELFDKIKDSIDISIPEDHVSAETLRSAKEAVRSILLKERCLISTQKKTLSGVKKEAAYRKVSRGEATNDSNKWLKM